MPEPSDVAATLAEVIESSREGDWTLRSALVRVAQPEPVRASAVLELVRRAERALSDHARPDDVEAAGLLAVAVELDAIADALVGWACDRDGPPPVDVVEHHGARAHARLEDLGVPREEGPTRGRRG